MDKETLDRFDKMDSKFEAIHNRIGSIETVQEKRISKLENYFYIAFGIAMILGITAGVLGTLLLNMKKAINSLELNVKEVQNNISTAQIVLEKAKREAISAVKNTGDETIRVFPQKVEAQIPNILRKPFEEWIKEERDARLYLARWLYFIFKEAESQGLPKNSEYANGNWQQMLIEYANMAKKQLGFSDVSINTKKDLKTIKDQ